MPYLVGLAPKEQAKTTDPVEFQGKFFQVPRSVIQPKPVQKPHPPIYLAAYTLGAMKIVATMADDWIPTGVPAEGMAQKMEGIRGMAQQAGRNPSALSMVVRANVDVTSQPLGDQRAMFSGSLDQIKSDIQATKNLGTDEVHFDPSFSPDGTSLEGFMKIMEQMKQLAE